MVSGLILAIVAHQGLAVWNCSMLLAFTLEGRYSWEMGV